MGKLVMNKRDLIKTTIVLDQFYTNITLNTLTNIYIVSIILHIDKYLCDDNKLNILEWRKILNGFKYRLCTRI